MRFVVDECTGPAVANWLLNQGHDVISIFDEHRGLGDDAILTLANTQNRILITNDKDFGEKIFREHRRHRGVIFLRLSNERYPNKIAVLERLLESYADRISEHFVVVSEDKLRISR